MALADPNDLWPELEKLGEPEVRRRVLLSVYGHTKLPAVQAWLQMKDAERTAESGERERMKRDEELAILRSTKNAAWVAAIAALISMVIAGIAIWYARGKS